MRGLAAVADDSGRLPPGGEFPALGLGTEAQNQLVHAAEQVADALILSAQGCGESFAFGDGI